MKKVTLWKDIWRCFSKSKGRFFSILCLVALGSFALVGLQISGPDMRKTSENYFNSLKLADISIIGDYGIDSENMIAINKVSGADKIEYGYLKDVIIDGTNDSVRIFSEMNGISEYEIVCGCMPTDEYEISISSYLKGKYQIGDMISFTEKPDIAGNMALKRHKFKIVGFVNSCELLSRINMGQSTAGTGELQGYAVVTNNVFQSEVYTIARISFNDTKNVDPYSSKYINLIQKHKDELNTLISDQPKLRLASIKKEYQKKIDDVQMQINDAKQNLDDSLKKLTDSEKEILNAKQKYQEKLTEYNTNKKNSETQFDLAEQNLLSAKHQINDAEKKLDLNRNKLQNIDATLKDTRNKLDEKWYEYYEKQIQLDNLKQKLDLAQSELDQQISETGMTIDQIETILPNLKNSSSLAQYEKLYDLIQAKNNLKEKYINYETAMSQSIEAKANLDTKEKEYITKYSEFTSGKRDFEVAEKKLLDKKKEYQNETYVYQEKKMKVNSQLAESKTQLDKTFTTISENERKLADGWSKYNTKKSEVDHKIIDSKEKISNAQDLLNNLKQPYYALDTRREIPGSEGYCIYHSVSNIVDALANVFPIFLYFVAALVTLTTMTRFVNEERINSGTLKAIGYEKRDIVKKFTIYGFVASTLGAIIGITAGHIILPTIVYNAYKHSFTYPQIELHFYTTISIVALILAFLCTVVPAFVVASKELNEKPSILLQPKPPESGSKIFLECIKPLWNRMSFTYKVTARNIFRYKSRMLMTIFGVCGSVTLIFAGFSVQHSISGVKSRQFGEIMKYDLIVAKNDSLNTQKQNEINQHLTLMKFIDKFRFIMNQYQKLLEKTKINKKISLLYRKAQQIFHNILLW